MQKGYLARALSVDERNGVRDQGILPLEVFVDGADDGVAVTLEFDADETIKRVSKEVRLVRLDPAEASRQLDTGRVIATLTVPPGFIARLEQMRVAPQLETTASVAAPIYHHSWGERAAGA